MIVFSKLRALVLRKAATITTVSNALKEKIIAQNEAGDEIVVLPMGVDSESFKSHVEINNRSGAEPGRN